MSSLSSSELKNSYDNEDVSNEKRAALDDAWQRKLAERSAAALERDLAKAQVKDPEQDVDLFHKRFKDICSEIDGLLNSASNKGGISKEELNTCMNECVELVTKLQSDLARATLFLAPYDVRQSTDKIGKLTADIEKARTTLAPRKKFAFSKRSKATKEKGSTLDSSRVNIKKSSSTSSSSRNEVLDKLLDANELVISDRHDCTIDIESSELKQGQDVRLKDLRGCTVNLLDQTGSVRFVGLQKCKLFIGPVAGSCFFQDCEDCKFYVASRQVRIHDTRGSDFYLHVLSNPIIEHCSTLRFAPFCVSYPGLEEQLEKSGLKLQSGDGFWNAVDDFRWLKKQQSPNWKVIEEEERVKFSLL